MEFRDYYATLGVSKSASEKEIKQAYRKLARKLHPDVNPGDKKAESRFKEINEAYEVLGDPEKRKKYDELGANWRQYEQAQQAYQQGHGPGGWTYTTPGGPGGFRTMTPEEFEQMFGGAASAGSDAGGGDPFSDFFRTFFGGGASGTSRSTRGGRGRRRPGHDLEQAVSLTLEEAYHGAMRRVTVKLDGHSRTVDVRIPAGVKDGGRVRLPGEGEPGTSGGPAGDLYLRVRIEPHPRFERHGQDLSVTVKVPVTTAVLGGQVEVPTLAGPTLKLKVPPLTQNGQRFRLRGHGMPATRSSEAGDLYATVDVEVPRTMTDEARAHWEALARLEQ